MAQASAARSAAKAAARLPFISAAPSPNSRSPWRVRRNGSRGQPWAGGTVPVWNYGPSTRLPVRPAAERFPRPRAASAAPRAFYATVKLRGAEGILLATWPTGAVLTGEVALAAQYGVAVGTVRRALSDLVAEGMMMRRRKTGTVVTGRAPQHS